jgi:hypothetical protein
MILVFLGIIRFQMADELATDALHDPLDSRSKEDTAYGAAHQIMNMVR